MIETLAVKALSPRAPLRLTAAQQAVVNHTVGPALVFAAAGSGKTTALIQRIRVLVQDHGVAPNRILAVSFNRSAVDEIRRGLQEQGVGGVRPTTLHAFGYRVVRTAARWSLVRNDLARAQQGLPSLHRQLLRRTLLHARQRRLPLAQRFNQLDFDDFLDYLSRCKGNLSYADLASVDLPASVRGVASQATAPEDRPWYLELYRLYEEQRKSLGWITYDDMLLLGWEMLVRHPALLAQMQQETDFVLVDEYQDVNLAQSDLVERISGGHGNLMVIGDDDQTIYEWRGAATRFILEFQARHSARVYLLQENFRCRASQIALANAVSRCNLQRSPKQLSLTQGFDGSTKLHFHRNERTQADAIVAEVCTRLDQGFAPQEMAILVRLFAQTPPIEAALLRADVPYHVEGDEPFYRREEITFPLRYVELASLERLLRCGDHLSVQQAKTLKSVWPTVVNRPMRYIAGHYSERCLRAAVDEGVPLSDSLQRMATEAPRGVAPRMQQFADVLRWMAEQHHRPLPLLLRGLLDRIAYRELLVKDGEPVGRAKAAGIEALLALAEQYDRVADLEDALEQRHQHARVGGVLLTTIHRAKGLEWPVVIVPDCNHGIIPYERGGSREEERRLFYVALTRARHHLGLYALSDRPISSFLQEAHADSVLRDVEALARVLEQPLAQWTDADALLLARTTRRYGFDEFIARWWSVSPDVRKRAAKRVLQRLPARQAGRRLRMQGVTPADVAFWRNVAVGENSADLAIDLTPRDQWPTRRATRSTGEAANHSLTGTSTGSGAQRRRWSRTRRHSQSLRRDMVDLWRDLKQLLRL